MKDHLKKLFISATECFWWGLFILILLVIFGICGEGFTQQDMKETVMEVVGLNFIN